MGAPTGRSPGRPRLREKRVVTAHISVHPDDWDAFLTLARGRGSSASAIVQGWVTKELKKEAKRVA